ncbi:MAG: PAS domain-containing protein [Treponema sp.]|jgi:predicted transcriptional regulator YheO|nr:PAS domain-containing protein [Treponema sp.]
MAKQKNVLSRTDELIIESYKTTMDGMAAYYGEAFEIVLHDLIDLDHSIIKIVNGFHSGRREGAPITDFALSMLERITKNNAGGPAENGSITYLSSSKYGKPVKSTTLVIFGENKKPIGLLCINLYMDSPLTSLLRNFSLDAPVEHVAEHFISDSVELITRSLEKVKAEVLADGTVPASQKNKEIVTLLYYQGIFKLKDAVQTISRDLGISKSTVYLHIRALEEKS